MRNNDQQLLQEIQRLQKQTQNLQTQLDKLQKKLVSHNTAHNLTNAKSVAKKSVASAVA